MIVCLYEHASDKEVNCREVRIKTQLRLTSLWIKISGSLTPGGSLSAYLKHGAVWRKVPGLIQALVYKEV